MSDGLGFGANAPGRRSSPAASREVTRLAVRKGANPHRPSPGSPASGDLVLTCSSDLSRNRRVGFGLGKGTLARRGPGRARAGGRGRASPRAPSAELAHRLHVRDAHHRGDLPGAPPGPDAQAGRRRPHDPGDEGGDCSRGRSVRGRCAPAAEAIRVAREMRGAAEAASPRSRATRRSALLDDAFAVLGNAAAQASLVRNVHPYRRTCAEAAERDEQEVRRRPDRALARPRALRRRSPRVDLGRRRPGHRAGSWRRACATSAAPAWTGDDGHPRRGSRALREELAPHRPGVRPQRPRRREARSGLTPPSSPGCPATGCAPARPAPDGKVAVTTDPTDYVPVVTWARERRAPRAALAAAAAARPPGQPRGPRAGCSRGAPSWRACSATPPGPPTPPRTR